MLLGLDTALGSGFPEDTRRGCCSPAPQGVFTVPSQCHSSGDNGQNEQPQGKVALLGAGSELCCSTAPARSV